MAWTRVKLAGSQRAGTRAAPIIISRWAVVPPLDLCPGFPTVEGTRWARSRYQDCGDVGPRRCPRLEGGWGERPAVGLSVRVALWKPQVFSG